MAAAASSTRRRSSIAVILLVSVVVAAACHVMLRQGLAFGPDAWSYWGASVSLLDGRGFVDAHGLPVREWPILYPAWLGAVQAVFGVSVAALRLGECFLAGLVCLLCSTWLLPADEHSTWRAGAVATFCGSVILLGVREPGSELLMLVGLFVALLCIDSTKARVGHSRRLLLACALLGLAVVVLTRHAGLAFLPAVATYHLWRRRNLETVVEAGLLVTVPLGAWLLARALLDQGGTHFAFASERTVFGVLADIAMGMDAALGVRWLGLVTWLGVLFILLRERDPASMLRLSFILVALLGVAAMFSLVYVADAPHGRFVRFAALVVGGVFLSRRASWHLDARTALALLLIVPPLAKAGRHVIVGREVATTVTRHGGVTFLEPQRRLARSRDDAAARLHPDIVQPPLFRWQEQRLRQGGDTGR